MKKYLSTRFEAIAEEKYIAEVNHSLRLHSQKSTNNQKNNNPNYFYNENSQKWEKYSNHDLSDFGKKIKKDYVVKVKTHKKLHNENRKKEGTGFKKFDKSLSMFVFTFSEKMKVDFEKYSAENNTKKINEILEAGRKTAEEISKHFNNEIMYITFHTDEKGNPHFQGMATNYNKETGQKLNIQTNVKNGEICQDIIADNFEPLGHKRGISKKISGAKHLSTAQYKINEDLKKENKKLLEAMGVIYQKLVALNSETDAKKFLQLFTRYVKSEAKPKLEKLIIKYEKNIIKKEKQQSKTVFKSNKKYTDNIETSETATTKNKIKG